MEYEYFIVEQTTVIMDGSDRRTVREIMRLIDAVSGTKHGKAKCRRLDGKHPTAKVIISKSTGRVYDKIREILDERYPGLCIYNPPM